MSHLKGATNIDLTNAYSVFALKSQWSIYINLLGLARVGCSAPDFRSSVSFLVQQSSSFHIADERPGFEALGGVYSSSP